MSLPSEHPANPAWKNLHRKIEELQNKPHLPPEITSLVFAVARLALEAEDKVRFEGAGEQKLPEALFAKMPDMAQHASGAPVLARKHFPVDRELTDELTWRLLGIINEHAPQLAVFSDELAQNLKTEPMLLENVRREILEPDCMGAVSSGKRGASYLEAWERAHPSAPHFLRFVGQTSLIPSLRVAGRLAGERHQGDKVWQHGHCPVCGSQPLIGRLAGTEGSRMHTCSFCSFEFRVPRIGCPFCLETNLEGADYYMSDDEPGYLLDVCGSCKNYMKIADFRQFDRPWLPMLDDLASLTLDLYARQMGYTRPTLSGWGF